MQSANCFSTLESTVNSKGTIIRTGNQNGKQVLLAGCTAVAFIRIFPDRENFSKMACSHGNSTQQLNTGICGVLMHVAEGKSLALRDPCSQKEIPLRFDLLCRMLIK